VPDADHAHQIGPVWTKQAVILANQRISAAEAHEGGLVEEVADPGEALDAAMARRGVSRAPQAEVQGAVDLCRQGYDHADVAHEQPEAGSNGGDSFSSAMDSLSAAIRKALSTDLIVEVGFLVMDSTNSSHECAPDRVCPCVGNSQRNGVDPARSNGLGAGGHDLHRHDRKRRSQTGGSAWAVA
jgi:hypothetical protein